MPAGYVASQETALISLLNGAGAMPTFVPPRPAERGVRRHPTLVQNVETLANIALIARHGPDWFRAAGTADGARHGAGDGHRHRGPARASTRWTLGTTIGALLDRAGGSTEPPQAVLAGGYFGGWLPLPAAASVPLTDQALRAAGAAFGPGVLVVLPASACPLAETARVTSYLARQSAGPVRPVHATACPRWPRRWARSRSAGPATTCLAGPGSCSAWSAAAARATCRTGPRAWSPAP